MKQSEVNVTAGRRQNGADSHLTAARKCRKLSRRLRVPKTSPWSARIGVQFRDGTEAELIQRRAGKLSAVDYAILDAVYFAVSGLAEGYALLGKHGWVDQEKRAFHPVVETIVKLQRELKDDLARLGLGTPPKPLSITDCPVCGLSYFGECICPNPAPARTDLPSAATASAVADLTAQKEIGQGLAQNTPVGQPEALAANGK
jgi:hypothetical protein